MKRVLISAAITTAAVSLSAAPAFASTPTSSHQARRPSTYTVRSGDSIWSIGQRFGVNMIDLADYNHRWLDSTLYAGSVLRIPARGWTPSAAATPSPATTEASEPTPEASETPATAGSASPSPSVSYSAYNSTQPAYTPPATSYSSYTPSGVWSCIANLESGSNPATDTGNGYYGMYQFTLGTWQAAGGVGNPSSASAAEQTAVAQRVQQQQGWGAWPVTSAACGA